VTGQRHIDTVLFDIGDTLLDFQPTSDPRPYFADGFRRGHEYLVSRGLALPSLERYSRRLRRSILAAYLCSWITRREVQLLKALDSAHRGLGVAATAVVMDDLLWEMYLPMRRAGVADPHARPMLSTLRERGYKLGLISNTGTPAATLDRHLREEDLLEFFPMRVYSCEVGYRKPHPQIFEIALGRIGSEAGHTVFVGDKPAIDVRGARRLGMLTVLKWSQGGSIRSGDRPDHLVQSLSELPGILEGHAAPCPSN
jgi:HAD superfamily hydrolase (TIGR01549 family)